MTGWAQRDAERRDAEADEMLELRAKVDRVEALLQAWGEIPDYAPSTYDRGRVDQRHMAAEELAIALAGDAP